MEENSCNSYEYKFHFHWQKTFKSKQLVLNALKMAMMYLYGMPSMLDKHHLKFPLHLTYSESSVTTIKSPLNW